MKVSSPQHALPLVSVIITSYNYGKYLDRAIESALDQGYPNIEVIVCENGSTDDSLDVIRKHEQNPRLRLVVNKTNLGVIGNHNKGISESAGEFIVFLSADDYFMPGHIARSMQYYRENPQVDVLYSPALIVDKAGRFMRVMHQVGYPKFDAVRGRNEFASLLAFDSFMCFPTMLFNRRMFDELGLLDESLHIAADYEFVIRAAAAGKRFGFINEPSVVVRDHSENLSSVSNFVVSGKQIRDYVTILERYLAPEHIGSLTGYGAAIELVLNARIADVQPHPIAAVALSELAPAIERLRALLHAVPLLGDIRTRERAPLVSVILPTLGEVGLLNDALLSMGAQTYPNWEIMVMSDGGPNLGNFVASYPFIEKIRYVRNSQPSNAAHARNGALGLARGELVAYLDEDNIFKPRYLEAVVDAFADPNVMVTRANADLIIEDFDGTVSSARNVVYSVLAAFPVEPNGWVSLVNSDTPMNCIAHRRVCTYVIKSAFDETLPLLEDWVLQLRLSSVFQAHTLPESLLEVRFDRKLQQNATFRNWASFLPTLDRLYNAYAAPERVPQRQRYRDELVAKAAALQTRGNGERDVIAFITQVCGARTASTVYA